VIALLAALALVATGLTLAGSASARTYLTRSEAAALRFSGVKVLAGPQSVLVSITMGASFGRRFGRGHLSSAAVAIILDAGAGRPSPALATRGPANRPRSISDSVPPGARLVVIRLHRKLVFLIAGPSLTSVTSVQVESFVSLRARSAQLPGYVDVPDERAQYPVDATTCGQIGAQINALSDLLGAVPPPVHAALLQLIHYLTQLYKDAKGCSAVPPPTGQPAPAAFACSFGASLNADGDPSRVLFSGSCNRPLVGVTVWAPPGVQFTACDPAGACTISGYGGGTNNSVYFNASVAANQPLPGDLKVELNRAGSTSDTFQGQGRTSDGSVSPFEMFSPH
jgi:hypothetical protein